MTEAEWLTAEQPNVLWQHVRTRANDRACRLFACACVRRLEGFIQEDRLRRALRFAENAVDSPPNTEDRDRAAAEAADGCVIAAGVIDTFCTNEGAYALWFLPADEQKRLEEAYQSACRAAEDIPEPLPDVLSAQVAVAAYFAAFGDLRGAEGSALLSWADGGGQRAKDVDTLWGLDEDAAEAAAKRALLRDVFGNPFRPVTFSPSWRTDTALSLAREMYEARDFSAMPILADALQDGGCDSAGVLDHCRGPGPHVRGCWVVDLVLGKE